MGGETQQRHPCCTQQSSIIMNGLAMEQADVVLNKASHWIQIGPSKITADEDWKTIHKSNEDDDEDCDQWELRVYNDKKNTREKVARVLVQVTDSSEVDAFKIMMNAHTTGVATVGNELCYEVAEMYNSGLRQQRLLSEIIPVTSNGDRNGGTRVVSGSKCLVWLKFLSFLLYEDDE